jgi:hypothetical protein
MFNLIFNFKKVWFLLMNVIFAASTDFLQSVSSDLDEINKIDNNDNNIQNIMPKNVLFLSDTNYQNIQIDNTTNVNILRKTRAQIPKNQVTKSHNKKKQSSYRRQFYEIIFRQSLNGAKKLEQKTAGRKRTRSSVTRGKFNLLGRVKSPSLSNVKHLKYNPHLLRNNCSFHACYAPIRNLLVGRTKFIYASSTCGQRIPERFCILGYTPRDTTSADTRSFLSFVYNNQVMPSACFTCDSRDIYAHNANSHRIENVVKTRASFSDARSGSVDKWWQSENGKHKVSNRSKCKRGISLSII